MITSIYIFLCRRYLSMQATIWIKYSSSCG